MAFKDLTNQRFGRLTVVSMSHITPKTYYVYWNCLCDCGTKKIIRGDGLKAGQTKSCGCWCRDFHRSRVGPKSSQYKHGKTHTSIYVRHKQMMARCYDKECPAYPSYGGRGIHVCKEWHVFENFFKDMGDAPEGMTLDRIDNNSGYSKENCRWATRKEQAINRRPTTWITFKGETLNQRQWAEKMNISYKTLNNRLVKRKWPIERALTESLRKMINNRTFVPR